VVKRFIIFAALLLLALAPLKAQDQISYQKQAGALSTLYRGALPSELYPYKYNGTYFLESPTFVKGNLFYNGKYYYDILLNLDAAKQELLVKGNENLAPVVLSGKMVNFFTMNGKFYVNLNAIGFPNAPRGYYQLIRDGEKPILSLVEKKYKSQAGYHNGQEIGYDDPYYDRDVPDYFLRKETFYTLKNGNIARISRLAAKRELKKEADHTPLISSLMQKWTGNSDSAPLNDSPIASSFITVLPENFFEEIPEQEVDEPLDEESISSSYRNKVYVIGSGNSSTSVRVSGVVTDMETGETIPGVVIFDSNTRTHTESDSKGRYSITLRPGDNVLNFSYEGKEDLALKVELHSNGVLNVELPDRINLLESAIVSAQSIANHRTASMGHDMVNIRTIVKIPSAFGEGDILKAVLSLPGVKSVGEASGGFNVRGGSPDQNLVLFNGNTIYNPSHMFGIFSSFNPDIVENVELYKSSIPAQYGGRLSSVLCVESKRGNTDKLHGSLSIGLLTSRFHLDGPIGKSKKTTFIAGARTTYSDWILKRLPANSYYNSGSAGFSDYNLGITHRINNEHTIRLNGYMATDRFSFSQDTSFHYSNLNVSAEYKYRGENGKVFQLNTGYDQYQSITGIHAWTYGAYDLETGIKQVFLRSLYAFPAGNHYISSGLDVVGYRLNPGLMTPYGKNSRVVDQKLNDESAVEPVLFVSDKWDINEKLSVEGALRLSSFLFLSTPKFYAGPEFRLSARYTLMNNLSFKGGFNTMRQNIHLISNTAGVSPMDTWKLSDKNIAPTTGWQAAGGVYWTELHTGLDFSLEGYWKSMRNCLDYRPGAQLSMNPNLAEDLIPVFGKAYGVEAQVKKVTGNITGWVSYCYSRSKFKEMENRGFETLAHGNWYNAPFDKPHEFKLVANWAITHRYSVSANIDYSTGRPITVPVGQYIIGKQYHYAYTQRNSYRIPDYFRMDLAFNVDPGHYLKAVTHSSFTIGVYNVTGRKNPYSVFFKTTAGGRVQGYLLSVFATQIPYVSFNLLF
jgi:hypothetical protein